MTKNTLDNNLKNISQSQLQYDKLKGFFQKADLERRVNKAVLDDVIIKLFKCGEYETTLILIRLGIQLFPKDLQLCNLLGVCLRRLKRFPEAVSHFEKAILQHPENSALLNSFANVYLDTKDYDKALPLLQKALELDENYAVALSNIGICHREQDNSKEAILFFKRAISLDKNFANAYHHLAKTLHNINDLNGAKSLWEKCLEIDSTHIHSLQNLAVLFLEFGDKKSALKMITRAIELKPNNPTLLRIFTLVHKFNKNHPEYNQLCSLSPKIISNPLDKVELLFAQGKAYEDVGEFKQAWDSFNEAGKIKKNVFNYSIESDLQNFNQLLRFNNEVYSKLPNQLKSKQNGVTPIFIIGMPRSGTTLLERILSAHTDVSAMGELTHFPKLVNAVLNAENRINELTDIDNSYINLALGNRAVSTKYFTDKLPHNFLFWPIIAKTFPAAKIIHIKRDKFATTWSNFRTFFIDGRLGYSNTLEDTFLYYSMYEEYMSKANLFSKDSIVEVSYEELTSDPEKEIPRILSELSLEFDIACLRPELSDYTTKTASQAQVNQKIYTGSSSAWKKYESFIMPVYKNVCEKYQIS
jgi:tetratricopeptide (TPR) repeat protein